MENNFIDLHCHPAMKPFGKSFNSNKGENNTNRKVPNSIWHYDPPTVFDKAVNIAVSLTKFTQADFSTLAYGGSHIVIVSLYPPEKGWVIDKMGTKQTGDSLKNLVMGVGQKRIDYLQQMPDYFTDLEMEYNFYRQLDGKEMKIEGERCRYRMVSGFDEIEQEPEKGIKTIYVVLTIEGANVFNTGLKAMGRETNEQEVLNNIDKVKKWDKRLFFMGLTHHFYNEICGHAKSLTSLSKISADQSEGLDTGFTNLGKKVLKKLLDKSNGKRILIDVKHMSVQSRNEYYELLKKDYAKENIPLIVSHGAVNGFRSARERVIDNQNTYGKFQEEDINFFDDEIIKVAASGGIFGIQLDERRVGSKSEIKKTKGNMNRRDMLFYKSRLIWNQIQHIAETLDKQNVYGWGIQSIGSDFDGMINPLNGYWTAEQIYLLESILEKHAFNYINSPLAASLKPFNRINPGEIVDRFMHDNTYKFLQMNF
jgi:microsomal dipeptidase-like Zn-dependent dipeptidase